MTDSNIEFLNKHLPIFITHYSKLTDRKKFMLQQLNKHNIKATFINDFDKEELTQADKSMFNQKTLKIEEISDIKADVVAAGPAPSPWIALCPTGLPSVITAFSTPSILAT